MPQTFQCPLCGQKTKENIIDPKRTGESLRNEVKFLRSIIKQVLNDLPSKRDWLCPDIEKAMRLVVGQK